MIRDKFILIFEDFTIVKTDVITADETQAWEDGILSIVNCTTRQSYDGENGWVDLPSS